MPVDAQVQAVAKRCRKFRQIHLDLKVTAFFRAVPLPEPLGNAATLAHCCREIGGRCAQQIEDFDEVRFARTVRSDQYIQRSKTYGSISGEKDSIPAGRNDFMKLGIR